MDAVWKATYDSYMDLLYQLKPQGALLDRVRDFGAELTLLAEDHYGDMDILGALSKSGLQQSYNTLYMECQAAANASVDFDAGRSLSEDAPRTFNAAKSGRLPTVHEFIDTYRVVWESMREHAKGAAAKAYQDLFDVEKRTDDLIEAQMIIEREHLLVKLVTAGSLDALKDFEERTDPNFDLTSAGVNETIRKYADAGSVDEITYLSETARSTATDAAIRAQANMTMMTNFNALLFAWENNKRKIRTGEGPVDRLAMSMVLVRKKTRDLYRFLSEDLGLTFDRMLEIPFYRIMLLQPEGLDGYWRKKKVMHPENLKALRYILYEEILSDRSMEEILLTPQPYPYREKIGSTSRFGLSGLMKQTYSIRGLIAETGRSARI